MSTFNGGRMEWVMRPIVRVRNWLLMKLSMGRPVVMNCAIDGQIDFTGGDQWIFFGGNFIDCRPGRTVIRRIPIGACPRCGRVGEPGKPFFCCNALGWRIS